MSGVGLMGASAYLITMAGFHPSIAVLQVAIVGVRFFGIGRSVARYLERLVSHSVNLRVLEQIRVRVFIILEQHYPASLSNYSSSSILSLIIQDIESLENLFVRILSPVLVSLVVTIIAVIFVGSFSVEIGIILLIGVVLSGFIIPIISARSSIAYGGELAERRSLYQQELIQFFQFFQETQIYKQNESIVRSLQKFESDFSDVQVKQGVFQALFSAISFIVIQITVIGGLFLSAYLVSQNRIDPILVAVLYLVMLSSFESVANLSSAAQTFGIVKKASARLSEFENVPQKNNPGEFLQLESGFNILIRNVSFKYPGASEMTLQEINFSIRDGEKIAIVGKSGSGKTTLIDLLSGFYDDYSGSIKINGQELKDIDRKSLHSTISYVSSDPYIFDSTTKQNLQLANMHADDYLLGDILKKVKLDNRIPDLDIRLGEHGSFLSGGEIQRLGLARALIQDCKCILIDEPTENLDPVLAIDLVHEMLDWFSSKTLIWIMHKFYAMKAFDKIIVMDNGRIIEQGNHDKLIYDQGVYYNLYNSKFKG